MSVARDLLAEGKDVNVRNFDTELTPLHDTDIGLVCFLARKF